MPRRPIAAVRSRRARTPCRGRGPRPRCHRRGSSPSLIRSRGASRRCPFPQWRPCGSVSHSQRSISRGANSRCAATTPAGLPVSASITAESTWAAPLLYENTLPGAVTSGARSTPSTTASPRWEISSMSQRRAPSTRPPPSPEVIVRRRLTVIAVLPASALKAGAASTDATGVASATTPSTTRIPTSVEMTLLVTSAGTAGRWVRCGGSSARGRSRRAGRRAG